MKSGSLNESEESKMTLTQLAMLYATNRDLSGCCNAMDNCYKCMFRIDTDGSCMIKDLRILIFKKLAEEGFYDR